MYIYIYYFNPVAVSAVLAPLHVEALRFRHAMLLRPVLFGCIWGDAPHGALFHLGQSARVAIQLRFGTVMWQHQPQGFQRCFERIGPELVLNWSWYVIVASSKFPNWTDYPWGKEVRLPLLAGQLVSHLAITCAPPQNQENFFVFGAHVEALHTLLDWASVTGYSMGE